MTAGMQDSRTRAVWNDIPADADPEKPRKRTDGSVDLTKQPRPQFNVGDIYSYDSLSALAHCLQYTGEYSGDLAHAAIHWAH
jgi:hypothetical protein